MIENRLPPTIGMIINQYSEAFLKRSRGCIRVTSLISDLYFDELMDRELPEFEEVEVVHKKIHEEEGFVIWNYSMKRETSKGKIEGSFLVLQIGYLIFVVTGNPPSFLREGIMYLVRKTYPDIVIAYITAEEIYKILENFSKSKEVKLLYSKFVGKRMFGKRFTSLGYGTEPFLEAFKKARNDGVWIDSIRVFSENGSKIDFNLSRGGRLTYYRGNFEEYYEHILTSIEEYCSKRLKVFEKRGRRESRDKELRPILIQFDSKVFEDSFVRKQLINVVANYDYCNYSIIHDGNPHVYMNIVDRIDNSTFSLRTYGSDALFIAPKVKATKASLMRFSKHIMDKFREGTISDFSK